MASTTITIPITLQREGDEGLGFSIGSANPACVTNITPDGPAFHAGLRRGDIILSINGEDVTSLPHNLVVTRLTSVSRIELEVQRVTSSDSHSDGVNVDAESQQDSMHGGHHAPNPPSEAELEAYKPFSDLDLLLQSPPHMATFLNFVLSPQGVTEDETLYLLNLNWFLEDPLFPAARTLYNDFLATKAPMRISCVPDEVMQTVEQALSTKKPTSAMLRQAFKPTQDATRRHVAIVLRDFNQYLHNGFGDLCHAARLIHLSTAEELRLVEDMIGPHIREAQARQSNAEEKHVAARFAIVEHTLARFYTKSGGAADKYTSAAGSTRARQLSRKDTQKVDFYHMGHRFVTTTYTHPTFCAVCRGMILGLVRQGWDCIDCGMHLHKKNDKFSSSFRRCHTLVREKCSGLKKSRGLFGSSRRKKGSKHAKSLAASTAAASVSPDDPATKPLEGQGKAKSTSSLTTDQSNELSLSRSNRSSSKSASSRFSMRRGNNHALMFDVSNDPEFWQETVQDKTLVATLSKRETKRQELIYELMQTEKRFVRHLTIFKELIRKRVIAENVLSSSAVHGLFANVDDLLENNAPIADALERRRAERSGMVVHHIADVMLPYFRQFNCDAYATFCSGQQRALKLYNQQMKGNQAFADCIRQIEQLPDIERLTFRDFVAKPMQRLTKYPLLIEGILKGTVDDNTREREDLEELLQLAKGVLQHVQHVIRSTEDKKRLCEIDDKLDRSQLDRLEKLMLNDLPSSGFELIHEDALQLKCAGKMVEIRCILLTHAVIFCQRKDERLVVKQSRCCCNGM
ncbi:hypothetical protein PTSG_08756 [Salpingoeca rosetta]|uniref:Uncharacterized protein n=1 Tax=Salpingoeca rosetta (strain ATCC 50818 / BSB-021) TaxID=946362 RepID=F2UKL5_SALR5|nr:uncharacterized protein PTSG_08756 [Salpingoeca rosetta]EGD77664.1 hypothetical protein PTSG_08756 [Salpingoeca rosetta]|eukprot:XP_004990140.1 hypothetical protein PTSG_08756 [Salpingoeca rosetta]